MIGQLISKNGKSFTTKFLRSSQLNPTTMKMMKDNNRLPYLHQFSSFLPTETTPSLTGTLDQFRDPVSREQRAEEIVGRSWTVKELRRKSFEDLHRLWITLYKERNMLYTEAHIARVNQAFHVQPDRSKKVRKSMGAIRTVLGERKREKIAAVALRKMQEEEEAKGAAPDETPH